MDVYSQLTRAQLENLSADPANPQDGHIYWNTQIGKPKIYNATSTQWTTVDVPITYIENDGAESTLDGWATYADAAAVNPVDGTGGAPTAALTRTVATPLRGAASFLLTKDAADRQGEGSSYDFSIDLADQGQQLQLEFDYETAGTFVTGASSDLMLYVYDVTNAGLVALSTASIDAGSGRFSATFTAAANSTSYRVIYHIATVSAAAWTFKYDRVSVTPDIPLAPVISPLPTGTVIDYAGSASPAGFLFCNGNAVSRATYATLFATLGTAYGVGDGSSTFNIPDLRGRMTICKDDAGSAVPANTLLHSNFQDSTLDADSSTGSAVATLTGTPVIQSKNGSLQGYITENPGVNSFAYDGPSNVDPDVGGVTYRWTPDFNGTQSIAEDFLLVVPNDDNLADTNDFVRFAWLSGGGFRIYFNPGNGSGQSTHNFGSFSAVQDQEYYFEFYWDTTLGKFWFFIDGVLQGGATETFTFTPGANALWSLVSGDSYVSFEAIADAGKDYWVDDISFVDVVAQTVNHTAPPRPTTEYDTATPAGRVTVGESGIDGVTLGSAGGVEAYPLTVAELAVHDHTGTTGTESQSHDHDIVGGTFATNNNAQSGGAETYWDPDSGPTIVSIGGNNQSHTHSFTSNQTGSGDTHQNMPPALIVNKIIKY